MDKVDIWDRLTAQTQAAVEKSRDLYATFRTDSTDPLAQMREGYLHERRHWNSFPVALPSVSDTALQTAHGHVALRLYKPSTDPVHPVLLFCHGGGFILGNLDSHDRICRLLAQKSGWAVLAIDYALAPEQKFPVQPDQVFAVLKHVASEGGAMGLDAKRIALAGDSAGAHLCLGAALDARARGGPALTAQLLFYGGYGLRDSVTRRLYGWADLDGLDEASQALYRNHYTGSAQDREHPRNHLLSVDMAGLPRSFIGAVSYDPLCDDSRALAEFMGERKVPHELRLYEGVLHGFLHHSALEPKAMQAIEDGAAFLRELKT